jgi:hypothetical protein
MMQIALEIIIVILAADFLSGLFHWLEDSYGSPDWPIIGPLIIRPNMRHHEAPAEFTMNSWLKSAGILLVFGGAVLAVAWACGVLTWHVALFVLIAVNANEVHKWNHMPAKQRGRIVVALQKVALLQTPQHHGKHHSGRIDSHYCVITNLVNPMLEGLRFWRTLEWLIEYSFGIAKRRDPVPSSRARQAA